MRSRNRPGEKTNARMNYIAKKNSIAPMAVRPQDPTLKTTPTEVSQEHTTTMLHHGGVLYRFR